MSIGVRRFKSSWQNTTSYPAESRWALDPVHAPPESRGVMQSQASNSKTYFRQEQAGRPTLVQECRRRKRKVWLHLFQGGVRITRAAWYAPLDRWLKAGRSRRLALRASCCWHSGKAYTNATGAPQRNCRGRNRS